MLRSNRPLLVLILILLCASAFADIKVYLKNEKTTKKIRSTVLQEREYASFDEINSVFGSLVKQERSDHRIYLHVFGEQFIFMTGSAYYNFKNETCNMHYPLLQQGSAFYLPVGFITEQLPLHFPSELQYQANTLQLQKPKDKSVLRIVLDPGHGGKDPGAVGKKGTREKDLNLAVCLRLKQLLEQELGVTVLMTRADDRFVSLTDRTSYANDKRADLFVSLHTNASVSRAAKGLETYYLSTAKNSDARAVEALENGVVELYEGAGEKQKYDDLDFILSDLSQTEHLENSNNLATFVQRNLVAGTQTQDRGVKQANFYVLRGAYMPSILIEMGFISNPDEEALLSNKTYQERIARTVFEGIKHFKFRFDRIRNA